MQGKANDRTWINLQGVHANTNASSCGYCDSKVKGTRRSYQWGFMSTKTKVQDYELLMARGFRRCGVYYYKPDLQNSCCQLYTIRLDVDAFKISKSQKKVLKRFNKYLNGEIDLQGHPTEKSKGESAPA